MRYEQNQGRQVVPALLFFSCYLQEPLRTCVLEARQAPRCGRLFSWPCSCAAQRSRFGGEAAFDLYGRLQPGPRHFQQDLAVPLRFGLAGPTQTLLREFAEFCGRCRHACARLSVKVSAYLAMRQS